MKNKLATNFPFAEWDEWKKVMADKAHNELLKRLETERHIRVNKAVELIISSYKTYEHKTNS